MCSLRARPIHETCQCGMSPINKTTPTGFTQLHPLQLFTLLASVGSEKESITRESTSSSKKNSATLSKKKVTASQEDSGKK